MSLRDVGRRATRAKEMDDLFPVRDIETNSRDVFLIPRNLQSRGINKPENNDIFLDFEKLTIPEMSNKFYDLICIWYKEACYEVNYVIHDVRNSWIATSYEFPFDSKTFAGNHCKKTRIVSRLVMYYLITIALYVVKSCLWINQKMFQGLYKTLISSKRNTQMLIGLGIVFSLIVMAYVIGAPYCPEPATSTDP